MNYIEIAFGLQPKTIVHIGILVEVITLPV
jgi:hypothetical protein